MYFESFPTITYRNVQVRDISRSVSIANTILRTPTAFHPLEVTEGQREDFLAKLLYENEDFDWTIWLANQIVDPYYGWYLTTEQFTNWMVEKFGSIEDPQERILFWRNDWAAYDGSIATTHYDALPEVLKKYWQPKYGAGSKVIAYDRKQTDWTQSTNEIRALAVTNTAPFSVGTLCTGWNPGRVGTCQVISVTNSTSMVVKDPLGTLTAGVSLAPRTDPSSNVSITGSNTMLTVIASDEAAYFSPVYAYDYYYDQNEANKLIVTLDVNYVGQALLELRKDLNK